MSITWNAPHLVASINDFADNGTPGCCFTDDGVLHALWTASEGGVTHLGVGRYDGSAWQRERLDTLSTNATPSFPTVAAAPGSSRVVFAWVEGEGDIVTQEHGPGGFTRKQLVHQATEQIVALSLTVFLDGDSGERAALAWALEKSGRGWQVSDASSAGALSWSARPHRRTGADSTPTAEISLVGHYGSLLMAWANDHDIYFNRSTDLGSSWGTHDRVADGVAPSLAVRPGDGEVFLAYGSDRNSGEIHLQQTSMKTLGSASSFAAAFSPVAAASKGLLGDGTNPHVAVSRHHQNVAVVWTGYDGSDRPPAFAFSTDNMATLSSGVDLPRSLHYPLTVRPTAALRGGVVDLLWVRAESKDGGVLAHLRGAY